MKELSFNEVELTFRKACFGLGWDYGIAEEFGRAASWLTQWTDFSLAPLLDLAFLDQRPVRFVESNGLLQASEATANGIISCLDLLAAKPESKVYFARLPVELHALAGFAGVNAKLYSTGYRVDHGVHSICIDGHGLNGDLLSIYTDTIWSTNDALQTARCQKVKRLRHRASVHDNVWEEICDLANRISVPASEVSRRFGAGEQTS